MKDQKGITLVALIITIIVMLILVSVVVKVVIKYNLLNTDKKEGYDKKNGKLINIAEINESTTF